MDSKEVKDDINKLYKQTSQGVGTSSCRNVPNVSTSPCAEIVNPSKADLFKKPYLPTLGPKVFGHTSTPKTDCQTCKWTIPKPGNIDKTTMNQNIVVTEDPQIESKMQQKITKILNENQVVPCLLNVKVEVTCMPRGSLKVATKKSQRTRNSSAQTVLTLPPILPKELEDVLKPHFNNTEDQQCTEVSIVTTRKNRLLNAK